MISNTTTIPPTTPPATAERFPLYGVVTPIYVIMRRTGRQWCKWTYTLIEPGQDPRDQSCYKWQSLHPPVRTQDHIGKPWLSPRLGSCSESWCRVTLRWVEGWEGHRKLGTRDYGIVDTRIKSLTRFISADNVSWVLVPLSCNQTGGSHYPLRKQSIVTLEGYLCTRKSWYWMITDGAILWWG